MSVISNFFFFIHSSVNLFCLLSAILQNWKCVKWSIDPLTAIVQILKVESSISSLFKHSCFIKFILSNDVILYKIYICIRTHEGQHWTAKVCFMQCNLLAWRLQSIIKQTFAIWCWPQCQFVNLYYQQPTLKIYMYVF